ncbi:MAG: hypothetical protein S4CHLAM37_08730 [Chlamydiia bacterium]|nr:hypothetical protein [Chlamydiia bacterium]
MQNIGRNDPCPCGSKKKFKKCCGGVPKQPKIQSASILTSGSNSTSKLQSLFQSNVKVEENKEMSSIASKISKPVSS